MRLHTFRAILLIFSSLVIGGCALLEPPDDETQNQLRGPAIYIYRASYDEVWRATQKTLVKYPITVNNIDQGVIETEQVRADSIWPRPIKTNKSRMGKYSIHVSVVRGKAKDQEATRVHVLKKVALGQDFFSDEKLLPSDGYEENIILYRIQREIVIERSLKRAFEKGSDQQFETIPESEFNGSAE